MTDAKKIAPVLAGAILMAGLLRMPVEDNITRISHQVFAECAISLAVAGAVWFYANKWVAALMVSAFASSVYPIHDVASHAAMMTWTLAGVLYLMVYRCGDRDSILDAICVVGLFHFAFAFMQHLDIDPVFSKVPGSFPAGMMTSRNEAAALFAVVTIVTLRMTKPYWEISRQSLSVRWVFFAPIIVSGLILARSFGGAMALAAGMTYLAYANGYRKDVLGILACLAAYLLIDGPEIAGERFSCWFAVSDIFKKVPLFGIGTGHWPTAPIVLDPLGHLIALPKVANQAQFDAWAKVVQPKYWDSAHNDYIQVAIEQGIKAPIIMAGYLIGLFYRSYKTDRNVQLLNAAVIVCLVSATVHWFFHNGTTAVIGVALLALLDREVSCQL